MPSGSARDPVRRRVPDRAAAATRRHRRPISSLTIAALVLVLLGCLAAPPVASASAYSEVQNAYDQLGSGAIPPCQFTSATLSAALGQAPSYSYQYNSDVTDAIQAALAARANGDCAAPSHTGSGTTPASGSGAVGRGGGTPARAGRNVTGARLAGTQPPLPASALSPGHGGLPLVLVLAFAVAGALLILVLIAWLLDRAEGGVGPGAGARHALAEAELRMSARWEDLTDRLGR